MTAANRCASVRSAESKGRALTRKISTPSSDGSLADLSMDRAILPRFQVVTINADVGDGARNLGKMTVPHCEAVPVICASSRDAYQRFRSSTATIPVLIA